MYYYDNQMLKQIHTFSLPRSPSGVLGVCNQLTLAQGRAKWHEWNQCWELNCGMKETN